MCNSLTGLRIISLAAVAELADAQDSGSCARKGVEVQVLSAAPVFSRASGFYVSIAKGKNIFTATFTAPVKKASDRKPFPLSPDF